jgi:hypothetical protein
VRVKFGVEVVISSKCTSPQLVTWGHGINVNMSVDVRPSGLHIHKGTHRAIFESQPSSYGKRASSIYFGNEQPVLACFRVQQRTGIEDWRRVILAQLGKST